MGKKHSNPMTKSSAARIQSRTAQANGGAVKKGSFASRATRAAVRNGSNGKR